MVHLKTHHINLSTNESTNFLIYAEDKLNVSTKPKASSLPPNISQKIPVNLLKANNEQKIFSFKNLFMGGVIVGISALGSRYFTSNLFQDPSSSSNFIDNSSDSSNLLTLREFNESCPANHTIKSINLDTSTLTKMNNIELQAQYDTQLNINNTLEFCYIYSDGKVQSSFAPKKQTNGPTREDRQSTPAPSAETVEFLRKAKIFNDNPNAAMILFDDQDFFVINVDELFSHKMIVLLTKSAIMHTKNLVKRISNLVFN